MKNFLILIALTLTSPLLSQYVYTPSHFNFEEAAHSIMHGNLSRWAEDTVALSRLGPPGAQWPAAQDRGIMERLGARQRARTPRRQGGEPRLGVRGRRETTERASAPTAS